MLVHHMTHCSCPHMASCLTKLDVYRMLQNEVSQKHGIELLLRSHRSNKPGALAGQAVSCWVLLTPFENPSAAKEFSQNIYVHFTEHILSKCNYSFN